MNENIPIPPGGDVRLALIWAGVTLALAIIRKLPFKKNKKTEDL